MPTLLDALRAELVAQGIGRLPRAANPDLPPIWVGKGQLPGPGDTAGLNAIEVGRDAVVGLYVVGGIPQDAMNYDRRRDRVDCWIRVLPNGATTAYRLGALIRSAVTDRMNWKMGGDTGLRVIQSLEWTSLQPVETGVPGESDTWLLGLLFETYAAPDGWLSEPTA